VRVFSGCAKNLLSRFFPVALKTDFRAFFLKFEPRRVDVMPQILTTDAIEALEEASLTFELASDWQPNFDWLPDPLVVAIGARLPAERDRSSFHCVCRRFAGLRGAVIRQLGLPANVAMEMPCDFDPGFLISFGELLAAAAYMSEKIRLFNTEGECAHIIEAPSAVLSITQFGDQLAMGCEDLGIYLYSREGVHTAILSEHSRCVFPLCTLGELLASGSCDDSIKLWNKSGSCIRTLTGHTNNVLSLVAWGELLASGCGDGTIKLWDASGTCIRTIKGQDGAVYHLVVFNDLLVNGTQTGTICWWDKGGACVRVLRGHSIWIRGLASSGAFLASACKLATKIWNADGECMRTIAYDSSSRHSYRPLLFWQGRLFETVVKLNDTMSIVMWE
jgi:WD40 repeat protein